MRETQEIPRENWSRFLSELSNREKNKAVHVEVEGMDLGDQTLARSMQLVGISCEEKGSEANAVELTVANLSNLNNLTHMIENPQRIYARPASDGEVAVLDIEGQGRVKTMIFFEEHPTTAPKT
jgi:hypothetical protein